MLFSQIIKSERKKKQMTQSDLAERLNVSDKTVSAWETGRSYPDLTLIKAISEVLEISPNTLFECEDLNQSPQQISHEKIEQYNLVFLKFKKSMYIAILLPLIFFALVFATIMFNFQLGALDGSMNRSDIEYHRNVYHTLHILGNVVAPTGIIAAIIVGCTAVSNVKTLIPLQNLTDLKIKYYKLTNWLRTTIAITSSFFLSTIVTMLLPQEAPYVVTLIPLFAAIPITIIMSLIAMQKWKLKPAITPLSIVCIILILTLIALLVVINVIRGDYTLLSPYLICISNALSTIVLNQSKQAKKDL